MNHFSVSQPRKSNAGGSGGGKMGLGASIVAEHKHPWFHVNDVDGRTIDVEASFAPAPKLLVIFLKFLMTTSIYHVFVLDMLEYGDEYPFYFIYLTHWTLVTSMLYFPLSLLVSLWSFTTTPQPTDRPHMLVRMVWALFSTSCTLQVAVTLLYWIFEYHTQYLGEIPGYTSLMKHGGIMILILVEGQLINKIPVRIKHLQLVEGISLVYLFWTLLHFKLGIGNNGNNAGGDDDSIYPVLNWRNSPETSAGVVAIVTFVVVPILFLALWGFSFFRRRYTNAAARRSTSSATTSSNYFRI